MKRSGGKSGRPFGHVTIEQLEKQVSISKSDASELTLILAELGHRTTKRAMALKDLVKRLLRTIADEALPQPPRTLAPSTQPTRPQSDPPITPNPTWRMEIAKADLVEAIGTARSRPTLRRVSGGPGGFEADVIISGWEFGLSIRSSDSAMDIDGHGTWPSPIRLNGAALRRLAPKLPTGPVVLEYQEGRLRLAGTAFPAEEV